MGEIEIGHLMQASILVLIVLFGILGISVVTKKYLSKTRFLRFIGILGINLTCCLFPMGPFGLIFGFPSAIVAALIVSILLDRE